ncbi:peptidoglycan-binding domain-containing protein [Streptomyces sp. NBC_01264]|uniref:peptidoglycan-binding domain-containing protein n=1 Tax=Streptomyces sp. NBC_01264 TaxID=2903804 RepID=UPI003D2FF9B0
MVTVRNGNSGAAVKALQVQLNKYNAGLAVDGAFGSGTESKVKAFQQSKGLNPVDGIVGPATWEALLSGSGSGSGGGSGTLTHAQAAAKFSAAGIGWTSSGGCSDRNSRTCTSFDGLRTSSANGAVSLKQAVGGCTVTITGGTETGHSAGTYSHANGYKLDFQHVACLTNYITGTFPRTGERAGDGAPLYTAPSGNIYADEGNHWDVTFMN